MAGYPGVKVRVAGTLLDSCDVAMPLQIVHGRATVTVQADAPQLEMVWASPTPPAQLGDPITVNDSIGYYPATWGDTRAGWGDAAALWGGADVLESGRFSGYVDQLTATELGGQVVSWQVSATGGQAALGYRPINLTRTAETDVARVQAISAAAGTTITIRGNPGISLAAGAVDGDALAALQAVCESTGGLLWQDRTGRLTYGTADHRANVGGSQIACEVIGDGLTWAETTEPIINDITVRWGPSTAPSEVTHTDSASTAKPWGVRHADVSTMCAAEADADQLGLLILGRRAQPYWGTPAVLVYVDDLDVAQARTVSRLDISAGALLPIPLDEPGPVPADLSLGVLEGWVETWDVSGHTLQLAVGDVARWVLTRLRTWNEADNRTWSYWRTGSWSDALIKEPGDPV